MPVPKSHSPQSAPTLQRPKVIVNMAASFDGKIATADRQIVHFGSPHDQRQLYTLRSTADAILCGARTVEEADATLGNGGPEFTRRRRKAGRSEFPLRVIVSGRASLSPQARIWSTDTAPILVLTSASAPAKNLQRLVTLADCLWISPGKDIDFQAALQWLHTTFGIQTVVCEGGSVLNDALFRAQLVDEVRLTVCPRVFGGLRAPTLSDGLGVQTLAEGAQFQLVSVRQIENELFLRYRKH